jgi:hypothetical protein
MTCKRVADLLAGQAPDRLPWLPELNTGFVRKTLGVRARGRSLTSDAIGELDDGQAGADYLDLEARCAEQMGADHLHRVVSLRKARRRVSVEADGDSGLTVIHTPAGDLRQRQQWDPNSGTVFTREHLVKGVESFPAYRAMIEDEVYEPDYAAAEAEIARSGLATIDAPATPLMHLLMWVMDVQPTLMAMMDHEAEMAELMEAMHVRNLDYYRLAAAGPGEIVRPMEDTSAMLTGPRMYARHCVAHLNDYADVVHAAGKLFVPHMCGHLGGMLDVLADVRLDGIEAITTPPLGDADLPEMRLRLGDVWLIGGLDPSMYATASPQAMAEHVRVTLEAMRGDRKFILGHEEIPVAAKRENVQAVAGVVADTAKGFYG